MDHFTFIDSLFKSLTTMIGALAWPAAIFGTVWLFRKKLNELLPLLILKHKDWQVSFGQELASAEKAVEEVPKQEPSENEIRKSAAEESRLEKLAKISPKAAIVEAYREIETATLEFAKEAGLDENLPYYELLSQMSKKQVIDQKTRRALLDIRLTSKKATRYKGQELDEEEALRYVSLVVAMSAQLSILRRRYIDRIFGPKPATPGQRPV